MFSSNAQIRKMKETDKRFSTNFRLHSFIHCPFKDCKFECHCMHTHFLELNPLQVSSVSSLYRLWYRMVYLKHLERSLVCDKKKALQYIVSNRDIYVRKRTTLFWYKIRGLKDLVFYLKIRCTGWWSSGWFLLVTSWQKSQTGKWNRLKKWLLHRDFYFK